VGAIHSLSISGDVTRTARTTAGTTTDNSSPIGYSNFA